MQKLTARRANLHDVPEIFHNAKEVWQESKTKISLPKITQALCSDVEQGASYVFEDEHGKIVGCLVIGTTDLWWTEDTYDVNTFFWFRQDYRTFRNLKKAFNLMKSLHLKTGRKFYYETFAYNEDTGNVCRGRFL